MGLVNHLTAATTAVQHHQVRALAGTGKTSSCVEGLKRNRGVTPAFEPSEQQLAIWDAIDSERADSVRVSAFNNAITFEARDKLAAAGLSARGVEARGIHSLGNQVVTRSMGRLDVNNAKWVVPDVTCTLMGADFRKVKLNPKLLRTVNAVDELVALCKQNLVGQSADFDFLGQSQDWWKDELDALTSHYDVDTTDVVREVYGLVPLVMEKCKEPEGRMNFDDMLWLPIIWNLNMPRVDLQIIDESQDLNRAQQELIYRAGHRIIAVGDPNQAIYGFAGADAESMDRMRDHLSAKVLPLTVTRRCSKAVVREAQQYVLAFEAHPSNSEGRVGSAVYPVQKRDGQKVVLPWDQTYCKDVQPGDFVLCRCNAPLVAECFRFIKNNIKANIQGRDVAARLKSTVEKLKASSVADLVGKLSDWLSKEVEKENAKRMPSEALVEQLTDRHDCILCFTEATNSVADVVRKIDDLFTDNKNAPGVKMSSIHRSKGLEADNVFVLQPAGRGPRRDKMQAWEVQQEVNLDYVACTRAKEELTYVS